MEGVVRILSARVPPLFPFSLTISFGSFQAAMTIYSSTFHIQVK